MTIEQLITILENKIRNLIELKALSVQSGDIAEVERLDMEIVETQSTLDKVRS